MGYYREDEIRAMEQRIREAESTNARLRAEVERLTRERDEAADLAERRARELAGTNGGFIRRGQELTRLRAEVETLRKERAFRPLVQEVLDTAYEAGSWNHGEWFKDWKCRARAALAEERSRKP